MPSSASVPVWAASRATSTPEELALFEEMEALESADVPDPTAIADIDVRVWVDGPGQPATRVPEAIRERSGPWMRRTMRPAMSAGRPIPLDPPAAARLADLRCPVLAIAGALDVSEVAQTARHLESEAPDARAEILPDVAHMIGMEIPDELARRDRRVPGAAAPLDVRVGRARSAARAGPGRWPCSPGRAGP